MRTMMNRVSKRLRELRRDASGNMLMLAGLGMPVMIGGAGLGVDTAQWYLWRRELQYAVDQAALSGTYVLARQHDSHSNEGSGNYNQSSDAWRTRATAELSANKDVASFTGTPLIQKVNFGDGTDNSVSVQVAARKKLPFSGLFLPNGVQVRVSAQAAYSGGDDYDSCLIATNLEDSATIHIVGNAEVRIGCGIAALSTNPDAIRIDGNAIIDASSIVSAGGIDVGDNVEWENGSPIIAENVGTLRNPYEGVTTPNNPTARSITCVKTGKGGNAVTTASLLPGTYSAGNGSNSLDLKCDTTFAPGVYVVDGGMLKINSQYNATGTGVMFVLKNGGSISVNGGANVSLTAPTASQLAGMGITDERLAGMLIFQDPNDYANNGQDPTINGNSTTILNGVIYIKNRQLKITGGAKVTTQCLMMVADSIVLTGTADLTAFCPSQSQVQQSFGGAESSVRLVA